MKENDFFGGLSEEKGGELENVAGFDQLLLNQTSVSHQLSVLGEFKITQLSYSTLAGFPLEVVTEVASGSLYWSRTH